MYARPIPRQSTYLGDHLLKPTPREQSNTMVTTDTGEHLWIGVNGVTSALPVASDIVHRSEIEQCSRWFALAKSTRKPTVNSFWLHQFVQNWVGEPVSHGAVILAAHQSGVVIGRDPGQVAAHVSIGISTECIDEFDCGCAHP